MWAGIAWKKTVQKGDEVVRNGRKLLCLLLCGLMMVQTVRLRSFAAEAITDLSEPVVEVAEEVVEEEIVEEIFEEIIEEVCEEEAEEVVEEIIEEILEEEPEALPEETEPVWDETDRPFYDGVPLYFQTDYPDVYYGEGTVATSGCSMTSLAMVASFMTGHEYLPGELARYFAYCGENNMERLEYGSNILELPFEKNTNWHTTLQALEEGKIAIVLVDNGSQFTNSQHFIVLTGLTEDGKILVNDPYAPNYELWALKQGFEEGFPEEMLVCGFQGAWVYDRNAMPEEIPEYYYEEPPETVDYGEVPLYFQNDYPDVRYAGGTVVSSGCSVTSLAMVASFMTGHEYLPDELARYFGGRAENHMARIETGSETLQIPYEKNTNWHATVQALREGKIAIALVNDKSHFTRSQHFLVLTGITPDGRILVNDSWRPNYTHWALQEGFEYGFEPEMILCGFEGAWVYDKGAMPENPMIYYEPEPVRGESRYEGMELSLDQEDLLASVIWAEARGESAEGQQAVAEVVLNRLVSEDFSDNLDEVIFGEGQFRSVPYLEDAEPSQAQYEALEKALYGPNILPMDVYYFATWETNSNVWGRIGNHIFCYAE